MRGLSAAAALLAIAACTGPAGAQAAGDAFAGTWAFQTEPYTAGQGQVGAVMSGIAIIAPEQNHRYDIRMLVHEYISQGERSVLLTARETCHGEVQEAQFSITCEMAEPLEGYQPDTFVVQAGEADELLGVLTSASSAQVTFSRLR
jgi:hypothetical protein